MVHQWFTIGSQYPAMSLKLFRVTEFAESVFFTPQLQRRAVHPATVVLLTCLWLASVGNLALWQSLWPTLFLSMPAGLTASPESGSPAWWPALQGVVRLMALSVTLVGAMLVPVTLVCWRWTLKIGITLLLFSAAFGTCVLWQQQATGATAGVTPALLTQLVLGPDRNLGQFFNWECALTVLLVAVMPALLLWRIAVRRIPFSRNILMNAMLIIASYVIWTGTTTLKEPDFQEIVQKHRLDPSGVNPVNTLLALGRLLPIKPGIF